MSVLDPDGFPRVESDLPDGSSTPCPPDSGYFARRALILTKQGYHGFFSVCAVLIITFGAFELHFSAWATAFIYFVIIVLTAMHAGFWEAAAISFVAAGCLDYYFLPPLFTFGLTDAENWTALAAFELAGLVVSRLSSQAQLQAEIANRERNRMEILYGLARSVLLLDRHQPAGGQIARSIQTAVEARAVAIFDAATAVVHTAGPASAELKEKVRDVWLSDRNQDDPSINRWSRILRLGRNGLGAIMIEAQDLNPIMVDGIASIAAVAYERFQSLDKQALAEAAQQSEQLRSTVLDALAHAFKTPLTAIMASSSGLLEAGTLRPQEAELVSLIDEEAVHLNDLATRLLQTARLDSAAMRLKRDGCTLAGLIEKVLAPFSQRFEGRLVEVSISGEGSMSARERWVPGDCELIATALRQLVDNAVKYSDPGTKIRLAADARDNEIIVSVHNFGPAIRTEDRERIFERFYRSPGTEHRAAGTGLGLSITKKIAEAHRGRVWVLSGDTSGTTFFFGIPVKSTQTT